MVMVVQGICNSAAMLIWVLLISWACINNAMVPPNPQSPPSLATRLLREPLPTRRIALPPKDPATPAVNAREHQPPSRWVGLKPLDPGKSAVVPTSQYLHHASLGSLHNIDEDRFSTLVRPFTEYVTEEKGSGFIRLVVVVMKWIHNSVTGKSGHVLKEDLVLFYRAMFGETVKSALKEIKIFGQNGEQLIGDFFDVIDGHHVYSTNQTPKRDQKLHELICDIDQSIPTVRLRVKFRPKEQHQLAELTNAELGFTMQLEGTLHVSDLEKIDLLVWNADGSSLLAHEILFDRKGSVNLEKNSHQLEHHFINSPVHLAKRILKAPVIAQVSLEEIQRPFPFNGRIAVETNSFGLPLDYHVTSIVEEHRLGYVDLYEVLDEERLDEANFHNYHHLEYLGFTQDGRILNTTNEYLTKIQASAL